MKVLHIAPHPEFPFAHNLYSGAFRRMLEQTGEIEIYPLSPSSPSETYLRSPRGIKNLRREFEEAYRKLKTQRPDIIHSELGWFTNREFYLTLFAGLSFPETPLVITVHDPPVVTSEVIPLSAMDRFFPPFRKFRRLLDKTRGRLMSSRLLRSVDGVMILTESGRKLFLRRYPGREESSIAIPHCAYRPTSYYRNNLHRFSQQKFIFLFFGYLIPWKGCELLIRAFGKLLDSSRRPLPSELWFVGGPFTAAGMTTYRRFPEQLRGLAEGLGLQNRVKFLGALPDEEVGKIFSQASCLILPYGRRQEGRSSGPLLIALGEGIPVIASDLECFREFIPDSRGGLLFTPGSTDELTDRMKKIMAPGNAEKIGLWGKKLFLKKCSWERVGPQVISFYNTIFPKEK